MHIRPFGVEIWMNEFENQCEFNLAETCVESMTIQQLLGLAGLDTSALEAMLPMKLTYGAILGSDRLRDAIAAQYDRQARENILVTHGTIGANSLVHQALLSGGDRVVSIVPTYQQHYSIPESVGADVQLLQLRANNDFLPDMDELRSLVTRETKLIAVTNPNNPTGALMEGGLLDEFVDIARQAGAWILSDEVYRGTDQEGSGRTASIADLYERGISTAGMSKAFSLAGLRLGWLAAPHEVIEQVIIHRDYNTISVGMVDDYLSAIALEHADAILARSQEITRGNLEILADWVGNQPLISWVKPRSGTTAFLKFDLPMSSRAFCETLLRETGVLFTPGEAFDMDRYVRVGYANGPKVLRAGLEKVGSFLSSREAG
jgi:aspartate/methionine/tyrosine aminotransferase